MNHTKHFFLMLMLAIVSNVAAWGEEKTSTLSFTSACGGSGTADDGTVWTVTSDASESTFDSTKGIHYGTSKVAVSYLNLTTNAISGTITEIVVNASGASNTSAKLNVTVGGNAFGSEVSLTGTATRYTFTGSASGEIVIKVSQSSAKKALYIKSVTVTYEKTSSTLTDLTTFEFSDASPTINLANTTTYSQEVSFSPSDYKGDITYKISDNNTAGATIFGSTVTVTQAGSVTVTASGTATDVYNKPADASYTLTVTESGSASNSSIYVRVKDASQLVAGKKYIIATEIQDGTPYSVQILGKQTNANYRDKVGVATIQNNTEIDLSNPQAKDAVVLTLGGETGAWTFLASDNNKYLSLNSKSNYLQSSESVTSNSQKWTITSGFQVKSNYDTSRSIQYNSGSSTSVARFACYSSDLKAAYLYVQKNDNQVATPTFDPVAGEVEMGTEVTFNCSTEGVTYYYTTDGTEPTTSSASGSSYTVNSSVTLKVIAVKSGMDNSEVATASYTIAKNSPNLAFSVAKVTANIGDSFTPPTLSYAEGYDGTITYSSSNSAITVNAETGEVSFDASAAGKTTTITATASETDNFSAGTTSYVLNVINPNAIEGNLNNATFGTNYDGSITDFVSASGNIGTVTVTYARADAQYAYINDSQIRLYNGSKLSFTAPEGVYILSLTFNRELADCSSDKGTISGNTWLPGDGEEVNSVTITRGGSSNLQLSTVAITLSESGTAVQRPSISPVSGTQIDEKTQIKITSEEGTTIYYTTDGSDPVKDGALTGTAKAYTCEFTLTKAGTVKAVARDAGGNFSEIVSATYTYNGTVTAPYYENFDEGLGNFTVETSGTDAPEWIFRISTGSYGTRKYAYVNGSGKQGTTRLVSPVIDLTDETIQNVTLSFVHAGRYFDGYNAPSYTSEQTAAGNALTHAQVFVREGNGTWQQVDIPNWFTQAGSDDPNIYERVNSGEIPLDGYKGKKIQVSFLYTADESSTGIWNVLKFALTTTKAAVENYEIVEMKTDGFVTYVVQNDIDVAKTLENNTKEEGANVHVYKVTEFSKTDAVFVEFGNGVNETLIPAETPVIIKGTRGVNKLVIAKGGDIIAKPANNLLLPSYGDVAPTDEQHLLVFQKTSDWNEAEPYSNYAFFKLKTGRTIPNRKAYLNGTDFKESITTQTNPAKGVFLMEDLDMDYEIPLGVEIVNTTNRGRSTGVFDLMGRKVADNADGISADAIQKGVYIVNGRKVVVK